jgi:DNA-binding transcriptional MerR regulator
MTTLLLPELDLAVPADGLSISEAARATGASIDTLRYYEREGLLLDPAPRNGAGRRRYGSHDLAWIAGLVMLRGTGMPIADIRVLADLSRREGTEAQRLEFLRAHRRKVVDELAQTRRHLAAIEKKIGDYEALGSTPAAGEATA